MHKFKLNWVTSALFIGSIGVSGVGYAADALNLDTIVVSGKLDDKPKIGESTLSAKKLERQQAQNIKDIVKYETGVSVVEAGRFGTSGFAIRGVDENRVAISVDGVAQAETLSSQGFKDLFEGYGNFNNTRNSVEVETLSEAKITKGADSLMSGSGALGGGVAYKTKDARDLLLEKNYALKYKTGFSTENDEKSNSLTFAGRASIFDILAIGTWRNGHETKNYDYKSSPDILGKTREKTDPYNKKDRSILLKIGTNFGENNRLTVAYDRRRLANRGLDKSYSLNGCTKYVCDDHETDLRHTHDESIRTSKSITFENTNSNPLWDTFKLTYTDQRITQRARTDDYCDGEQCAGVRNPLGLHYNQDNQLVDQNNKPVVYTKKTESQRNYYYVDEDTYDQYYKVSVPKEDAERMGIPKSPWGDEYLLDYNINGPRCNTKYHKGPGKDGFCEVAVKSSLETETLEANGTTYDLKDKGNNNLLGKRSTNAENVLSCSGINCDKKSIEGLNPDGTKQNLSFTVFEKDHKKFALLPQSLDDWGYVLGPTEAPSLLVPNSPGYNQNNWKKRDLNTRTQQINLDLTKYLELGKTQHELSYGGLYSRTRKSMVNTEGTEIKNAKWWIDYPKSCEYGHDLTQISSSPLCTKTSTASFLIPTEAKTGSLYFKDELRVNAYLGFDLGYRYDRVNYKAHYQPGITPKIPDDMLTNLFIQTPHVNMNQRSENPNDPNEIARRQNAEANINYISQPKKFSASSYAFRMVLDPLDWLQLQAKYSKGFRAPTADELYFTFKHPEFTVLPGSNLKSETAKTKEAAVTFHHDEIGFISGGYFVTNYNDFIDLDYKGTKSFGSQATKHEVYQAVNLDRAKVEGIELKTQFTLGKWFSALENIDFGYQVTKQKGKANGVRPINVIQPMTQVFSIGYTHPDDKFGLNLYVTHVAKKEAKDTYNIYSKDAQSNDPSYVKDKQIKWRSGSYTVTDLTAFVTPIKHLTIRAGVYNLFNRKYMTWDSARSIRMFGTSNLINQATGAGINRFYAPGRNYRLSVQFEF